MATDTITNTASKTAPRTTPSTIPGTTLNPLASHGFDHVVYAADALSAAELDALPYGMIQLDARGTVLRYSAAEARLSGFTAGETLGRNFFREVAPCTQVAEFFGRFEAGVAAGRLDVVFDFEFAFRPPRAVRVHLFYSRVTRSVWVKVVDAGAGRLRAGLNTDADRRCWS